MPKFFRFSTIPKTSTTQNVDLSRDGPKLPSESLSAFTAAEVTVSRPPGIWPSMRARQRSAPAVKTMAWMASVQSTARRPPVRE